MLKIVSLALPALSAVSATALAHIDPVAHGTGTADHHHPFIGIEPLVVLVLAIVAIFVIAGGLKRRAKTERTRRDDQ